MYQYLNSTWQRNHDLPRPYPGIHTTDLTANFSYSMLDEAVTANRPFFLMVTPIAPHSETTVSVDILTGKVSQTFSTPVPQEKYKDYFPNATVPRTENFNPDQAR